MTALFHTFFLTPYMHVTIVVVWVDAIEVTMHSYIMTDGEPLAVWLHILVRQ